MPYGIIPPAVHDRVHPDYYLSPEVRQASGTLLVECEGLALRADLWARGVNAYDISHNAVQDMIQKVINEIDNLHVTVLGV